MKKCYICVLATAFLFGTMEVAAKYTGGAFNSIQLTFLRFLIGGLMLLPFAISDLKKRGHSLTAGDLGYLLFLGVISISISMTLLQVSMIGINANLAAIIICTNPLFTMIFAHFVADDPFTKRKAVVLLLMLIGLVIVANPAEVLSGGIDPLYLGCAVVAAVTFGLYTAYGKRRIASIGGMAQNAFSFLFGCAVLLPVMLIADIPIFGGISAQTLPVLLYLGIFVTGLGYYFYMKAIELGGPSVASIAFFLKPVIAPILAFIVLGEPITANLIAGVLFILAGSYVNMAPGLKAVKAAK
ncbi:MAG TPA: DMT family transporter [Firmicutes bacterium]|nr:DMT family transporter [Bacillota bacterium]